MSYWTFVRIIKTVRPYDFEHFDTSFDQIDYKMYIRYSEPATKKKEANRPKIKIAVSPNDMSLYLQRMDIIGALCKFFILGLLHNNSHCVYIFQSI